MDSLHSNLFTDFYQPEHYHQQQHHLQHFHPQQENASRFASPLSSTTTITTTSSLFPTYANSSSSSCPLPSSPPPLSLSRRGSACSTSSIGDEIVTVEPEDFPRARLTREQILLLERQFSETPKPNTKVRRALAETTGLSTQRVGNWFQNRRAKAKLQKRQEELHTKQILESAGRRRVTEPSSPVSFNPSLSAHYYQPGSSNITTTMVTPKPRRAKSTTELPKTPATYFQESMDSSPYDSPAQASYASLDRSIAQAEAAAARANAAGGFQDYNYGFPHTQFYLDGEESPYSQGLDGTQSPWPVSHFSDYGSSNATPLYTPTPAGQLEDPFEYDRMTQSSGTERSESSAGSFNEYDYPTDDYAAFAAAIQMNTMSNTFSLPPAPPGRFVREKQVSPWDEPVPHQHQFVRRDSCPGEFIEAFGSVEIKEEPFQLPSEPSQTESQASIAARRRGPKPAPLGSASLHRRDSLTGAFPQSAKEPKTAHLLQPATPMRRIKSTGASLNKRGGGISKVSPPSSPIDFKRFADCPFHDENYTMDGATIRPRTSGSISGSSYMPLSQIFPQSGAPPTPVSPADSENSQEGPVQQNTSMEPVAIKFDHSSHNHGATTVEGEMSPPQTPCNSTETKQEECEEKAEDITPRIGFPASSPSCAQDISSVPRDFYNKDSTMIDLFSYSMASAEAMSSSGSSGLFIREEAFPFERFLSQPGTACTDDVF